MGIVINILSLDECIDLVKNRTENNIVSIRSSTIADKVYAPIDENISNYKDIIVETFDDIEHECETKYGYVLPKDENIRRILEWSDRVSGDIVVHCTAGISRSSAVAYLIACRKMDRSDALACLKFNLHTPNRYVLYLGAKIMDDLTIYSDCIDAEKKFYDIFKARYGEAYGN